MSEKEKQHYVPKFYLRYFSFKENKKQIGIFNTENHFFIQTAKLKTQAYNPFFYGKDGSLEEILSFFENSEAKLLNKIIKENYIPERNSPDHVQLIKFLILTQLRNPKSVEYLNQSAKNFSDIISKKSEKYQKLIRKKITNEEAISLSLSVFESSVLACGDLQLKIIINESEVPFITCDNPLTKYNTYLETKKYFRGTNGFGNIGLQMFFPLTPNKLLIAYDASCYKIGSSRKQVIISSNLKDIQQLNILHFLNCNTTVFFNDKISKEIIENLYTISKKYEKANKVITKEITNVYKNGVKEKNSSIILTMTTAAEINLNLSFIKILDKAKYQKIDHSSAQIRPFSEFALNP
ncbi:MAG: DUF4238 domain-containing protein [Sphingobacteriales bacterium]|nr:DUF4238 domain-containing protein [Sphingobacteriales bacterium]MBP8192476.1 DUF4238 domain-containing protein [Chitinophagales bacterium]